MKFFVKRHCQKRCNMGTWYKILYAWRNLTSVAMHEPRSLDMSKISVMRAFPFISYELD